MSFAIPTRTYAKKGEKICCKKGHIICTVARNIPVGAAFDRRYFEEWQQPEPGVGEEVPGCRICQSNWYVHYKDGPILHFQDGGWRWAEQGW